MSYRIRGKFCGMKFSLNRKQTGFSQLYFRGSQVHRGKVACYVLLKISNCCKLANFHGLNFRCISRWSWNLWNLHTTEISACTVLRYTHWYQCIYLVNIPEPVQYYIYVMAFSFDLKCKSVTHTHTHTYIYIKLFIYMCVCTVLIRIEVLASIFYNWFLTWCRVWHLFEPWR